MSKFSPHLRRRWLWPRPQSLRWAWHWSHVPRLPQLMNEASPLVWTGLVSRSPTLHSYRPPYTHSATASVIWTDTNHPLDPLEVDPLAEPHCRRAGWPRPVQFLCGTVPRAAALGRIGRAPGQRRLEAPAACFQPPSLEGRSYIFVINDLFPMERHIVISQRSLWELKVWNVAFTVWTKGHFDWM